MWCSQHYTALDFYYMLSWALIPPSIIFFIVAISSTFQRLAYSFEIQHSQVHHSNIPLSGIDFCINCFSITVIKNTMSKAVHRRKSFWFIVPEEWESIMVEKQWQQAGVAARTESWEIISPTLSIKERETHSGGLLLYIKNVPLMSFLLNTRDSKVLMILSYNCFKGAQENKCIAFL